MISPRLFIHRKNYNNEIKENNPVQRLASVLTISSCSNQPGIKEYSKNKVMAGNKY
jgi:hypothetical protein